ncbi:MAG: dipeptidase [Halioglobus sp.]|nr:dipeptidase [Halioglobus sp.]
MRKLLYIAGLLIILVVLMRAYVPIALEHSMNQVQTHTRYPVTETGQALHDSLFIADLHTDSTLWRRDLAHEATRGHVDLPRLRQGNVSLQVFSATTKSPRGQNYKRNTSASDNITLLAIAQGWPLATWNSLYARANYQLDRLHQLTQNPEANLLLVRNRADLNNLIAARRRGEPVTAAMYLIEGAHSLEGKLDNLDKLHARGLHFVGLTHFFDNRLGGSLHGVSQAGLTPFGEAVVRRAEALGMNIDIAHASPQMVRDVLTIATRPVILSHGGFKGNCDTPRNLDDSLMQEVAAQGGIIGVGYWDGAICEPTPSGIARAIRYGIELLGIEHIALGSDFDGTVTTPFDTAGLAALTQALLDQGFSEAEIRAVMGENVKRYLMQQLPAS